MLWMRLTGGQEPEMTSIEWLRGKRSTGKELAECLEKADRRLWYEDGIDWQRSAR